jgi:hypothetical protein
MGHLFQPGLHALYGLVASVLKNKLLLNICSGGAQCRYPWVHVHANGNTTGASQLRKTQNRSPGTVANFFVLQHLPYKTKINFFAIEVYDLRIANTLSFNSRSGGIIISLKRIRTCKDFLSCKARKYR